jgi:hypothetical protein
LRATLLVLALLLLAGSPAPFIIGHAFPVGAATVFAASPSPSAASGDTRSPGEGPGLVGRPGEAILGVVALALVSALLTLAWVRITGDRPNR